MKMPVERKNLSEVGGDGVLVKASKALPVFAFTGDIIVV